MVLNVNRLVWGQHDCTYQCTREQAFANIIKFEKTQSSQSSQSIDFRIVALASIVFVHLNRHDGIGVYSKTLL